MKHIAILDFGSQYTHLIARNIREMEVLAKIYPHNVKVSELKKNEAIGVILSGGPQAVYIEGSLKADPKIFNLGVPVLGICYGHQLMAHLLGGEVKLGEVKEFGRARFKIKNRSSLFRNLGSELEVWMSHGDSVSQLPAGFISVGSTKDCPITAMANEAKKFYGLQFHPEVDHTLDNGKILNNFVLKVCKAKRDWKIGDILSDLEKKIKAQVKDKKVFVLVSGGVDSNVAFALLTKALGKDKVLGLYIDTGFMRLNESDEIMEKFKKIGFDNIRSVDASKTFFGRLVGIYDPEEKRRIIGQVFLDTKDSIVKDLGLNEDEWLLGQGTIYPDTIESGATKNADKIKTHHNRVDAIQKMVEKGLIVEPLVDFYKDEVRAIGRLLELPDELINRHPFPGPGLAIRCLCRDAKKPIEDISEAATAARNLFGNKYPNLKCDVLPIRSVGVQGDNRTYAHPLVVWGESNWKILSEISIAATNTVRSINRIILLLNPSEDFPRFSFHNDNQYLTHERVERLRRIDAIVDKKIKEAGIYDAIWQFPVVLIPITDENGKESVVLRPINSRDAMTLNFYEMDQVILKEITEAILATGEIGHIFYDITNKPPGTTEWE